MDEMRVRFDEQLGAGLGHEPDAGLIRLAARRKEQRVLGAQELRDARFEPARGMTAVEHIVPDFRLPHGAARAGRRLGDGVVAEIDRRSGRHPRRTRCWRRIRIKSYVSATSPPRRNTYAV